MASITKVMTAMVVLDAHLPLDEMLTVDISQTPEMKGIYSRVRLNSQISRRNMLLLALMSSENRAAASLAHHYPGGYDAFIRAMNAKAQALGMTRTRYVEPTGLSIHNVSTARDLTKLLIASEQYPLIGQLSTTKEDMATFVHPAYTLPFRNTNHLVYRDNWNIQLTKTGFTNAAGHCLIMRTVINQRPVALVVMDAFGKYTHFADASRLRTCSPAKRSASRGIFPEAAPARLSGLPLTHYAERLLRQRPVAIAERALHNQGIPPVAHLIADAAQLSRHAKTELFMNRNRPGVAMPVADNRQHLPPRSLFAFLN